MVEELATVNLLTFGFNQEVCEGGRKEWFDDVKIMIGWGYCDRRLAGWHRRKEGATLEGGDRRWQIWSRERGSSGEGEMR